MSIYDANINKLVILDPNEKAYAIKTVNIFSRYNDIFKNGDIKLQKATLAHWKEYFCLSVSSPSMISSYVHAIQEYTGKIIKTYETSDNNIYYLVSPINHIDKVYYLLHANKQEGYKIINGDLFKKDDELFKVV